ncbi:MAG: hypothetical protein KGZ90_14670 [Algoriphagus sp.]|nr:hypothetical protein [Algoriphagus sp.]
MKKANLFKLTMLFLLFLVASIDLKAEGEGGCRKKETGYKHFVPSGAYICVLNNSARECFALVDRCKYP